MELYDWLAHQARCGSESRGPVSPENPRYTRLHPPRNWLHYLAVSFREKIIPWEKLDEWRAATRARKERLVATNGCFDILHIGHVTYLEAARNEGDALLVGLTSDRWVCDIKGPGRPINDEKDRAAMLAALESVTAVCIFPDKTALNFLSRVKPEIYVKGGDYTLDTLVQEERRMLEEAGVRIVLLKHVPGKSTSALLEKISKLG